MTQIAPSLNIGDLSNFLDEVSNLFDNMVESWSQILFGATNRGPIKAAWDNAKPSIQIVKSNLDSSALHTKLSDAGLVGPQLDLKLKGLNDAWKSFWERGTLRLLRRLLSWINTILGSIASVVPGGEALKELKEAMEKLIEDEDS